ncbi:MAG: D-arabinono-1,4-lactone oxidase [Solirubrobacterales bacterium]
MKTWRNWAGDQRCTPARIERPESPEQLAEVVRRAAADGLRVRAAGAGHSFTDIACTGGVMIDVSGLDRTLEVDAESGRATVGAGIGLREMNERLYEHGRAMENLGDIDKQAAAGAIATATHGTGSGFRNISSQVEAVELVSGEGEQVRIDDSDPEALAAARVNLGALGILTAITFRTVPAFTVHRVDSPLPLAEALERLDQLADGSEHFEFYVFPHTETALMRQSERTDAPPAPKNRLTTYINEVVLENYLFNLICRYARRRPQAIPRISRFAAGQLAHSEKTDRSYRVFASQRRVRFTEMEYAIPRRHAAEAISRVMALAESPELDVSFPIEVRFVAADDAPLSTAEGRDTCYIAVHMFNGMPWEPYFRGVEEIMNGYGGRPHWGKRHFQSAETLAERYPRWEEFGRVRARLDPGGRFRNDYVDRVLGPVAS